MYKSKSINQKSIATDALIYMKAVFDNYRWSFNDNIDYNPLNHIYLLTYYSDTNDPEILIKRFKYMNSKLLKRIADGRQFYDYIKFQHSGVFFVDCDNSKDGYVRDMHGLHVHAVNIVHPDWESKYIDAVRGMDRDRISRMNLPELADELVSKRSKFIDITKVAATEDDVINTISYCAKALMSDEGIFHGRNDMFEFFGCRLIDKEKMKPVRGAGKIIHRVPVSCLTNPVKRQSKLVLNGEV